MEINSAHQLQHRILYLENKNRMEEEILREQFSSVVEGLKPANLIKRVFKEVTSSPLVQHKFFGVGLGLSVGMLSKKLIFGKSKTLIGDILGNAIEVRVANIIERNSAKLQAITLAIYKNIFSKNHRGNNNQSY